MQAPALPPLKSALHIITPSKKNPEPQDMSASQFESRVKRIVQNLNLATVSGDRQTVKTRKGVAEPLVAKVFLLTEKNVVPLSNIPVIFNYEIGSGVLEKEKTLFLSPEKHNF